jgi:hypothetical protein
MKPEKQRFFGDIRRAFEGHHLSWISRERMPSLPMDARSAVRMPHKQSNSNSSINSSRGAPFLAQTFPK